MGTLKVLQYAHLVNVKRFLYSSSGCGVYGLDSKMPFEEHDISISYNIIPDIIPDNEVAWEIVYELLP